MNVYKLHKLSKNIWGEITYQDYIELSEAANVLNFQIQKVSKERKVAVLNTTLFIVLDYFGNRNNFYNSVVIGSESNAEQVLQPII